MFSTSGKKMNRKPEVEKPEVDVRLHTSDTRAATHEHILQAVHNGWHLAGNKLPVIT